MSTSPTPPGVTVVVVPRERFSAARRSLESIYRETAEPFALVYVDGGSPSRVRRYLGAEAQRRGFRLLRSDHYLSPNQARNLGAAAVDTPYFAFVDNDVIVTPGWLSALVRCAEETGASVVGPLCLIGELAEQRIHMASGQLRIEERLGCRRLIERHAYSGKVVDDVRDALARVECDVVEFHTLLVRTDVFRRVGPLDERLLNTREHLDFCMSVQQAGGTVYFEPASVMTYLPPRQPAWSDLPYMMLRWSEAWNRATLAHFCRKWDIPIDNFDRHVDWLTEHRQMPLEAGLARLRRVAGWRLGRWVERRVVRPGEVALNRWWYRAPSPSEPVEAPARPLR